MARRNDCILQRGAARISQTEIIDQKTSKANRNLEETRNRDTQFDGVTSDRMKVQIALIAYYLIERSERSRGDADSLEEFVQRGFRAIQSLVKAKLYESMHPTSIEPIRQAEMPVLIDLDATPSEFFDDLRNKASNDFIHARDVRSSARFRRAQSIRLIHRIRRIQIVRMPNRGFGSELERENA